MASWRFSSSYLPRDTSGSRDGSADSKYGVSYIASKFGSSPSSSTERQSRWSKSNDISKASYGTSSSTSERPPAYSRPSLGDGTSSVIQRLKERYGNTETPKLDRTYDKYSKTTESKEPTSSSPLRSYTRSSTAKEETKSPSTLPRTYDKDSKKDTGREYGTYGSDIKSVLCRMKNDKENDANSVYNRLPYRKRFEKSPEPEKPPPYEYRTRKPDYSQQMSVSYTQPLENKKIYTSSSLGSSPSTTRYLAGLDRSHTKPITLPTSPSSERPSFRFDKTEKKENAEKLSPTDTDPEPCEEYITVPMTTRATSPTQPSTSVYVRTRRADTSKIIEKQVQRSKKKPVLVDKEIQTDHADDSTSKYSLGETNSRSKPWSSYLDKHSSASSYSPVSRYSSRVGSYSSDALSREPTISTTSSRRNDYLSNSYTNRLRSDTTDIKHSMLTDNSTPVTPTEESKTSPINIKLSKEEEKKSETSPIPNQITPDYTKSKSEMETLTVKKVEDIRNLPKSPEPDKTAASPRRRSIKSGSSSTSPTKLRKSSSSVSTEKSSEADKSTSSPQKETKSPSPIFQMSPDPEPPSSPQKLKKSPSVKSKETSPVKRSPTSPKLPTPPLKNKSNSSLNNLPTVSLDKNENIQDNGLRKNSLINALEKVISDQEKVEGNKEKDDEKKSDTDSAQPLTKLKSVLDVKDMNLKKARSNDSSCSESSSEEETTSSDSELEEESSVAPVPTVTSNIKRSITNFLQNIPTILTRKPTSSSESVSNQNGTCLDQENNHNSNRLLKDKSCNLPKFKFRHIESGERAWWLESNGNIPDNVTKINSSKSVVRLNDSDGEGKHNLSKQVSSEDWWAKLNTESKQALSKQVSTEDFWAKLNTEGKQALSKQVSSEDWWAKLNAEMSQSFTNIAKNWSSSSIKNLPPKVPSSSRMHSDLLRSNLQFSPDRDWLRNSSDSLPHKLSRNNSAASNEAVCVYLQVPDNDAIKQMSSDKAWWLDNNANIEESVNENDPNFIEEEEEEKNRSCDGNELDNFVVVSGKEEKEDQVIGSECTTDVYGTDNQINCDTKQMLDENSNLQDPFISQKVAIRSNEDGVGDIDVTPALRRRREQQQQTGYIPYENRQDDEANYQMKITQNKNLNESTNDGRKILDDFKMENTVKDITEKLVNQNGIISPTEEKNICLVEPGDMSGMISKAKAELLKTKNRNDIKKSSSGELSPIIEIAKSEIEIYWKELIDSMNRPLKLYDLDFTDLNSDDENDVVSNCRIVGDVPPPPPLFVMTLPSREQNNVPVPPPQDKLLNGPISPFKRNSAPPVPVAPPPNSVIKSKKTVKLFWKEVKDDPIAQIKIPNGLGMIWDEINRVTVDTLKLEHLFESRAKDLISKKQQEQNKSKEIYVLDHKRSNAINIGMTKLPPPRAIKTAILKMDATVVNREGIEKLLTMLPTEEERVRIQDAQSANPDLPLGSAEQFLLTLASISELEARLKLWAFKLDFENSEKEIAEPLMDLKQGIEILKVNKTFRCILSTLLSIGNFLNGYDAKGFQIDYLSKVPEVKDTVHKHSLLHHLCFMVMEKFPDSTDLYSEIGAVTRASRIDFDELAGNIKKVEDECKCSWNHLKVIAKHEGHTGIKMKMSDFLADCAERIIVLGIVHRRVLHRFQKFVYWLGIPLNRISTTKPNEICRVISEFALEYRTTRERVMQQVKKMNHREKSRTRGVLSNDTSTLTKKMNSKEAKDDAELRQLLGNDSTNSDTMTRKATWRRQRKETRDLTNDINHDNDNEILETLIKTANQIPSSRTSMKERRRSRISDRKF